MGKSPPPSPQAQPDRAPATDTIAAGQHQPASGLDQQHSYYRDEEAEKPPEEPETALDDDGNVAPRPTEEERLTLRKIPGRIPTIAYWLCAVEFAERASYYGVQPLFNNFVNKPLPAHGNGAGATQRGTQDTPGALGMGPSAATAVSQSFSTLVYAMPIIWGWLADSKLGRYSIVFWGVIVCGFAHILMVGSAAPALLQAKKSTAPFMLSVYILAIGAGAYPVV
jgi:dipeptide/tripeptide permease